MGRQIQIYLASEDEDALTSELCGRFPDGQIVDAVYPADWDRQTLTRSTACKTWLIVDSRTVDILCESAQTSGTADDGLGWLIRSRASSCVEWMRHSKLDALHSGRLYLNTDGDPIWLDVSSRTGDDIEKMYNFACRWVRRHCENCSEFRRGLWVSHSLVKDFRIAQSHRRPAQATDPRDARYYELQKKHRSRKQKLSAQELQVFKSYCDEMIEFVRNDSEALSSWQTLRSQLDAHTLE